mmetsp:Transcript_13850/g.42915  ORF Transcript_13850/g.42915 Transcript_13850/m.42915 type:complete len:210 (+) Transcript_13850:354-983(+)
MDDTPPSLASSPYNSGAAAQRPHCLIASSRSTSDSTNFDGASEYLRRAPRRSRRRPEPAPRRLESPTSRPRGVAATPSSAGPVRAANALHPKLAVPRDAFLQREQQLPDRSRVDLLDVGVLRARDDVVDAVLLLRALRKRRLVDLERVVEVARPAGPRREDVAGPSALVRLRRNVRALLRADAIHRRDRCAVRVAARLLAAAATASYMS